MPSIRLRFYPAPEPNAAVKSGGSTIHAVEGDATLCGRDVEDYVTAEADPLDPGHSDFCKSCASKLQDDG